MRSDRKLQNEIAYKENNMAAAKNGDSVKIHYIGKLQDGTVFDSSAGRDPLGFTIGGGQVIPGFEEAVIGMSRGEAKQVMIPAHKAYGPRNEELLMPFPRNQVPPDLNPEVGQKLQLSGPNGEPVMVSVAEITEESIILDANPPLAGEDLTFDIELVEIA
jgi:peptidylprolyl isomerase